MTRVQGMTIACPDGWRDASMLVLTTEQPAASGVSPSFVITREPIAEDKSIDASVRLSAFVDGQVEQMRRSLTGPVNIARRQAIHLDGSPEVKVEWVSDGVPITQWITYAMPASDCVMIATGTTGRDDFDAVEATFRDMLRSFHFS